MATKTPSKKLAPATAEAAAVTPNLQQNEHETQRYGEIVKMPNGLSEEACKTSVELLNQCLADTITLRDMYKKHHWQVVGPTFNQLHLMYDQHFIAQVELVDIHALFAGELAPPAERPLCLLRCDGSGWMDTFLRPVLEASGYRCTSRLIASVTSASSSSTRRLVQR